MDFGTKSEWMIAIYTVGSFLISAIFYLMSNPVNNMKFGLSWERAIIVSIALIRRYKKFFFMG